MMRKGYVYRESWREEGEKKIADYWFDSNPQSALFWDTREEAETACTIFENRTIMIPSADGGEYRCTGFTIEELGDKFVVFCHAPFIPIAGRAVSGFR